MGIAPSDLQGAWSLRRRVVDRGAGLVGTVQGELRITAVGDGLTWVESGRFAWTLPGGSQGRRARSRTADVSRALLLTEVDGRWWMRFTDGGAFHPWQPGLPVEHPCGADLYRGLVDLDPGGRHMRTLWDVTGPAKNQRLITRLTR